MPNRFVQSADAARERNAWTENDWLCRPDLVDAEKLLLVRAHMAPGHCHPFHYHPHREEIIFVVEGVAEQWVDGEYRLLRAGEMAHIPPGVIHGTYNPHAERLVFLAILSPAKLPEPQSADPDPIDVGPQAPWSTIRQERGLKECVWGEGAKA